MKAWRKYNSSENIRNNPGLRLRTKEERRNQFSSEQATPSKLLYLIMYGSNWEKIIAELGESIAQNKLQRLQENKIKFERSLAESTSKIYSTKKQ